MNLRIDTSLIDLSKCGTAGISQPMARKLAGSVASYAEKPDPEAATVEDLLTYFPMRYEDRSNLLPLDQVEDGMEAAVELYVRVAGGFRVGRKRPRGAPPLFIFEITASDRDFKLKPVVVWWFVSGKKASNIIGYWKKRFTNGVRFIAYGRWEWDVRRNTFALNLKKPDELELLPGTSDDPNEAAGAVSDARYSAVHVARRVPVYRKLGEFQSKRIREIIFDTLQEIDFKSLNDVLPSRITSRLKLISLEEAFRQIHFPPEKSLLEDYTAARSEAHRRLIFEEFFWLSFALRYRRGRIAAQPKGPEFKIGKSLRNEMESFLPFELTTAQKRVSRDIFRDMTSKSSMNRLMQGDVGSGKTIVAFLAAYVAVRNGYQAVVMAPTEILAEQHFRNASRLFENAPVRLGLLTGSIKASEKKKIHGLINEGALDLLIGTHALIQEKVGFKKLGLAVIDEQHRFGVAQRAELRNLDARPDILVMTATPIPRSLAMTVYGDLEVSVIDELPPGRSPVKTVVVGEDRRKGVYKGIAREVESGRQVYIVYPLIEESEKLDLKAATDMYDELRTKSFPKFKIGLLHGKLKPAEKELVMNEFSAGKIDILVSTTVIEVGVDVPNATLMIVEHAERFGLSQLHQLRGRVGRGAEKSFCVLLAGLKKTAVAKERLGIMEESSDGFVIAEKDLELRGQGDIVGTRQSGIQSFKIANIIRDLSILLAARQEADEAFTKSHNGDEFERLVSRIDSDPRLRFYGVG